MSRSSPSRPARPASRRRRCISTATSSPSPTATRRKCSAITPNDVVVGTPPLAFTFGLGGLVVFPLRFGAASVLLEEATPAELLGEIKTYKATICVRRAGRLSAHARAEAVAPPISRRCGSPSRPARRCRPRPSRPGRERYGIPLLDGIGGTEMLHIVICNRVGDAAAGAAGRPVTGYEARIVDDDMQEMPRGERRPARRARPDRLPLSRRSAPDGFRARRLEPHRRHLPAGRGGPLPLRGARRRHDRLGGRDASPRRRSRRRCCRIPRSPNAPSSASPTRSAAQIVKAFIVLAPNETGCAAAVKRLQDHVKAASRRTNIRARSASSMRCRRPRPARCSASCCGSARRDAPIDRTETQCRKPMAMRTLHPKGWKPASGYANGIVASGPMVFVGGQIGWNAEQVFESDDFVEQTRQALENVVAVLAEAGARPGAHRPADLVRHRQARIRGAAEGDRRGLSQRHRPALSDDDAGRGERPRRGRGQGRDRGDRGAGRP